MITSVFWDMFGKLVMAAVLGGIIGTEREVHGRPAGLRTHMLVCLGSTLFTLCAYAMAGSHYDPQRLSTGIITGIGFIGAGTIMRQGSVVRGLTSAASVWAVAAIGVAVGVGGQMLYVSVVAAVMIFIILHFVPALERRLVGRVGERMMSLTILDTPAALSETLAILHGHNMVLLDMAVNHDRQKSLQTVELQVRREQDFNDVALEVALANSTVIDKYSWE